MTRIKKLVVAVWVVSVIASGSAVFATNIDESESKPSSKETVESLAESELDEISDNERSTSDETSVVLESGTETVNFTEDQTVPETETANINGSEYEMNNEFEWESNNSEIEADEQRENSWRFEDGIWSGAFSTYSQIDNHAWNRIDGYYVNSSGSIIKDAIKRGIDVSEWQGTIDWKRVVADDVSFAIIRCGAGQNYDDKTWGFNRAECERLGIPYGTYLYSYAQSEDDARKEAEHVLQLVNGAQLDYPIYYDLEDITIGTLDKVQIAGIAKAFCDVIESAGYEVQIYANSYWWENYLTDSYFDRFDEGKWVAQYNDNCTYKGNFKMWQSSSQGRINGIQGNVDMDFIMERTFYPQLANTELCVNSKWYYFDTNGDFSKGWVKHHNNQYYYDDNGVMQKNIVKIDTSYYGFDEWTGVQIKGEHYFTDGSDDHWYYFDEEKGILQTGWVKHHGNQYYYNAQGQMQYDEKYIDGYWYYFNEWTGVMATGWTTHHNEWYYYDTVGRMLHGEKFMDGHWYYFDESTGITANKGLSYHHDHWYYYNDYGYMQYGERYIDGYWYYFNPYTGIMVTGWSEHHGNKYYYDQNGHMLHGKHEVDGKEYYFDNVTGSLATNY